VPEWSIGAVSKTVERASVPRVRIPPSPPDALDVQGRSSPTSIRCGARSAADALRDPYASAATRAWRLYARLRHLRSKSWNGDRIMFDIVYVSLALVVFALFALAVRGCDRL
jgi:hypothetical protein